jgi:hypothetical protein
MDCVRVFSVSDEEASTTRDMKFMIGDVQIPGVVSIKLGPSDGDGVLRVDDVCMATIEIYVRLG